MSLDSVASSDVMGAVTEGSDLAFGESLRVRIGPGEGTTVNWGEYSFGCSLRATVFAGIV